MRYLDEILAANRRAAARYVAGAESATPKRKIVVLTCMDARIDPIRAFGLEPGDAHIVRNAGGRASEDALRSLVVSTQVLGTREILVVHHTDCGLHGVTNEQLYSRFRKEAGVETAHINFLPFADLAESVREDVARIRSSPVLPRDILVHGLIYDVRTGLLEVVE